ncbi:PilZ domain-containing protein [Psychromonas sp. psych-6C06]|uniref:PilZ domain-containing protein n=1 Tax=Psychromonas sp. psych-6C06 TaxID=2058089 RepID=UPI000C3390C2|nr:PilZ domain-containing protein [Psychromonas sp. psych-6C06]PKF63662.1 PilZ domain-containing protein [Psychromonas sp. psych-6C06]
MFFAQNDQRSFRRMELDVPIEITKGTQKFKGICKDLSSTGMSIAFTEASLQAGDEVHIKLDTEDERFPPLDADATLLRIDCEEDKFVAAVKFINMT